MVSGNDAGRAVSKVRMFGLLSASVLMIAYFFVYFHRMTGGAISDILESHYGVDAAAVGILASAYLYSYMVMQIPSGLITDRFGPRKAASVFVGILSLGSLLCAVSAMDGVRSFPLMVLGRAVIGIGASVISIPYMKVFINWFPKDRFSTLIGTAVMIGNIGAICAAYPMVMAIDFMGLADTYLMLTCITVVIALSIWLFVRDSPSCRGLPEMKDIFPEDYDEIEVSEEKVPMAESVSMVFSERIFWPVAIWLFLVYGTFMIWGGAFSGSFYGASGMEKEDYSMILMFVGVGMLTGAPLFGFISDRSFVKEMHLILGATVGLIAVWAAICLTADDPSVVTDIPFQCIINYMLGLLTSVFVVCFAHIKSHYPMSISGVVAAALNLFPFLGGAVCTTVAGFMIGAGSVEDYRAVWWACLAINIAALLVAAYICIQSGRNNITERNP